MENARLRAPCCGGQAAHDVRLGGMEIAAGRIDAQRPPRGPRLLPRGQAERVPEQFADIRTRRGGPRRKRNVASARERSEWIGLRRPVEIAERPRETVEMVFGAVV